MLTLLEARHNAKHTETLQAAVISTLGLEAVQHAIGSEHAEELSDLAQNAGILALGGRKARVSRLSSKPAANGVYLATTPKNMVDTEICIPYEKPRLMWSLDARKDSEWGAEHIVLEELPNVHLITAPVLPANEYSATRVALAVHELEHARQAKNEQQWGDLATMSLSTRVAREAQAYDTQFRVHDSLLAGALTDVYEASLQHGVLSSEGHDKTLVIPRDIRLPDGRQRLSEPEARTVIHYAHNQLGGYDIDKPDEVSQQLVDSYVEVEAV